MAGWCDVRHSRVYPVGHVYDRTMRLGVSSKVAIAEVREMSYTLPDHYTKHDVISVAQWLMAEDAYDNNWIHSAMYEKQSELTAKLRDAREWNGYLAGINAELLERVAELTARLAKHRSVHRSRVGGVDDA